ncbi:MAG: class I SAM-dependent methyltransferase [Oscillospiraceae bacterium]|nr:class I SAM-dependent methyltransferase [Oscillospiraceae bacterium]
MSQYEGLANCYDEFTEDVSYPRWADYFEKLFKSHNTEVSSILDLACGTGTLSFILAERGYEVIGVDASSDMLSQAAAKPCPEGAIPPLFLCQEMEELDLYGTVDAAVSSLDSISYLDGFDALDATLSRLRFFIRPGGLFIFDVNTEHKFHTIDGECFMRDGEDNVCIWRSAYDEDEKRCLMMVDVFKREGELWSRSFEEHEEYAFSEKEILKALEENGFSLEASYDELCDAPPHDESMRVFYVARRREE